MLENSYASQANPILASGGGGGATSQRMGGSFYHNNPQGPSGSGGGEESLHYPTANDDQFNNQKYSHIVGSPHHQALVMTPPSLVSCLVNPMSKTNQNGFSYSSHIATTGPNQMIIP